MKVKSKQIIIIVIVSTIIFSLIYPFVKSKKKALSSYKKISLSKISKYLSDSSLTSNNMLLFDISTSSGSKSIVTSVYKSNESDEDSTSDLILDTAIDDDILGKDELIYNTRKNLSNKSKVYKNADNYNYDFMPWFILIILSFLLFLIIKLISSRKI